VWRGGGSGRKKWGPLQQWAKFTPRSLGGERITSPAFSDAIQETILYIIQLLTVLLLSKF
jgi:hypothetical protein